MPDLRKIRDQCPALKKLMIPDWKRFEDYQKSLEGNPAEHRSIILLALERGHLGCVTSTLHRFLLDQDEIKSDVSKQYRKDLIEDWFARDRPLQRHQAFRRFMGKLVELQCAEWLESENLEIANLEALGGHNDIDVISREGQRASIEVKYVGLEDRDFMSILASLSGNPAGGPRSITGAANYVLFDAYAAARQLANSAHPGLAILVVEDMSWHRFRFPLQKGFIDWHEPRFLESERSWQDFFERTILPKHPNIEKDLAPTIRSLDEIWILRLKYGFQYTREHKIQFD